MKKVNKALVAFGVSAVMLATGFVGATSAFADPLGQGVITFDKETVTSGDKVAGYRLLDVVTEDATNGTFIYDVNSTYKKNVVEAIRSLDENFAKDDDGKLIPLDKIENPDIIKWLVQDANLNSTNIDRFAKAFKATDPVDDPGFPETTLNKSDADTKTVPTGYYLIEHKWLGDQGSNETYSKYMVNTVGTKGVTVQFKNGTVTLEKKVKDNELGVTNNWQDTADYSYGDLVPFRLTGTLPKTFKNGKPEQNIPNDFAYFEYKFEDTFGNGKDNAPAFTLYNAVGGKDLKVSVYASDGTLKGDLASSDYKFDDTHVTPGDVSSTKNGFTVEVGVEKTINGDDPATAEKETSYQVRDVQSIETVDIQATDMIVVEYKAILQNNANLGETGNKNTASLNYTNNPNTLMRGDTPEDYVKVFTFSVDGLKTFSIDPNETDLPKFELFRDNGERNEGQIVWHSVGKKDVTKDPKTGNYIFGWEGLDAGDYKLVEYYTPAGFTAPMHPVFFTIEATHGNRDADQEPVLLTLGAVVSSDESDIVKVNPSADGKKHLTGTLSTGAIATPIYNRGGNVLPSTGGAGTVALYVTGAAIVLFAGLGMAVALKKRRNA
ncbi:hypothetical protein D2E26_1116 [Bifidobacterium dolichotidis]|uniref:Gram-positive cocci surface proteins LPxTG domain-containing protein n=1 Tax=Bifidobacterium dolichotidis TaxID=2306976 RepID=A0A430FQE2_9BIFI|nr:SpaA isopeptide-forming pilin-related protein [Bifidobacterium dolichotidis]RSX55062.1 hypothetical protein D2E26_1116 [Bifidobacterium dolichotidis]